MATVRIPPVLRNRTGGAREIDVQGDTVGTALGDLVAQAPDLQDQLFDDGELRRYINVYLNDQDIQYLDGVNTPVAPQDTIIILPAMAGGA